MQIESSSRESMGLCGVYIIVCQEEQRRYLGSTANSFLRRKAEHIRLLDRGRHHCAAPQHAWRQFGRHAFEFRIEEIVGADVESRVIVEREQALMDSVGDRRELYNTSLNAASPARDPDVRKRMKASAKRVGRDPALRQKRSDNVRRIMADPERLRHQSYHSRKQMESPDARRRVGDSTKTWMADPEKRKQLAERTRLQMAKAGAREKIARGIAESWREPQARESRIAGQRAAWANADHRAERLRRIVTAMKKPEVRERIAAGRARQYPSFTSPDGIVHPSGKNLGACRKHDLGQPSMHAVMTGRQKSHKGWRRTES